MNERKVSDFEIFKDRGHSEDGFRGWGISCDRGYNYLYKDGKVKKGVYETKNDSDAFWNSEAEANKFLLDNVPVA